MRRRSACGLALSEGVMSKLVSLPDDYWEGYALMNKDEDIVEYTYSWDVALKWYESGEHGRKIAKIIIYDQEDVE